MSFPEKEDLPVGELKSVKTWIRLTSTAVIISSFFGFSLNTSRSLSVASVS